MDDIVWSSLSEDRIEVTCPKCESPHVVIKVDLEGHYHVMQCHKCGYRNVDN